MAKDMIEILLQAREGSNKRNQREANKQRHHVPSSGRIWSYVNLTLSGLHLPRSGLVT